MENLKNRKMTLDMLVLWTGLRNEENKGSDDVRDLITNNSGTKTGYFIMVDKPEKALTDFIGSAFHSLNREYVVFNSEKQYLKYRNRLPKEIGLICSDNLYGFGIITKIMRQSELKIHKSIVFNN